MPRYRKDYRRLRRDPRPPEPSPSGEPTSAPPTARPEPVRREAAPGAVSPDAASSGESALACPACGERLAAPPAGSFSDHCPRCGRAWFEGTLFRLHLQSTRPGLRAEDVSSALLLSAGEELPGLSCPAGAHGPLRAGHWEAVPLALCTACESVLLEPGRLADLERSQQAALRRKRIGYLGDALRFLEELLGRGTLFPRFRREWQGVAGDPIHPEVEKISDLVPSDVDARALFEEHLLEKHR